MNANIALSPDMANTAANYAMSVINHNNEQTMTSLQIAEITGKRHDAILCDISNLLGQGVNAHNFVAVDYTDAKGEKRAQAENAVHELEPKLLNLQHETV